MKVEILEHLSQVSEANWLIQYKPMASATINPSQKLQQQTQALLTQLKPLTRHQLKPLKILISSTDTCQFLASFLAAVITEARVFLCNPNWREREWQQVFDLVQPDLILGDSVNPIAQKPAKKELELNNLPPLIMIPTGGSSGKIRFAMHSWSTLTAAVRGFRNYFQLTNVSSCCVLPLYHVSGLMQFLRSFLTQGKLVVWSYTAIKQGRIPPITTQDFFLSLVPTQLQLLLQSIPEWLSGFQTILLGGAPVGRSLLETARKQGLRLAPTYGMTETASQVATLKPEAFLKGNSSSGQVLPHAEITIHNHAGELLPAGQSGIINIQADSLCLGYYPDCFSASQSRVFTTDDLGCFDLQGYLHILGRNSHKIITGGENVFPAEVEAAILATNLVSDVGVVGLSDPYWGQAVVAVYVPSKLDLAVDVIQAKTKLSRYKQPKYWIRVSQLPRNAQGKLNYQQLAAIAQQQLIES